MSIEAILAFILALFGIKSGFDIYRQKKLAKREQAVEKKEVLNRIETKSKAIEKEVMDATLEDLVRDDNARDARKRRTTGSGDR